MIAKLNALERNAAVAVFKKCCGSSAWASKMADSRPFETLQEIHDAADALWAEVEREDVLEAFTHHPEIGADVELLRKKFASTATWSAGEQSSVSQASEDTLHALRDGNLAYKAKFGYIFIVCATGKSAEEMLQILEARLPNSPEVEFEIAKGEQAKITHLRLEKLEL